MQQKIKPIIDTSKPFFEIQSFGKTIDVCQGFNSIKTSFAKCTGRKNHHTKYTVWKIMAGFKFQVPLSAMG